MEIHKVVYLNEMKSMVNDAIEKIRKEKPDFEIFTVSIWTDPSASASSINFDSKDNSDKNANESYEWNKKHYDTFIAEGDLAQAKLFEPTENRNCNPADFALSDFCEIENLSIPEDWEEETEGECWDILEPLLKEIGEYAYLKIKVLNVHSDFELSVNGRQDWYEFTWNNT